MLSTVSCVGMNTSLGMQGRPQGTGEGPFEGQERAAGRGLRRQSDPLNLHALLPTQRSILTIQSLQLPAASLVVLVPKLTSFAAIRHELERDVHGH